MHPSIRRVFSAARSCKNTVWTCLKSVRRIPLLGSCVKRKKNARRGNDADGDSVSTVGSDGKPKNGNEAKRRGRKTGESRADILEELSVKSSVVGEASQKTKDEILNANSSRCATETPTDSESRARSTRFVPSSSTCSEGEEPCNSQFTAGRPKAVRVEPTSEIKRNEVAKPRMIAREAAANATGVSGSDTKRQRDETEEFQKTVDSMLNTLKELTVSFAVLPIDTTERLKNSVDLVFEKAIREQNYTALYASLCSTMLDVQVTSDDKHLRVSFTWHIIRKCQSQFEADVVRRTDGVVKLEEISSCRDPEKKKELLLAYQDNERKLRERSVGNCRFIGELFKHDMVRSDIMMYCVATLIGESSDESLECLCTLLRHAGRQLELWCDLKDIFDELERLMYDYDRNVSSRMWFIIKDVIKLRKSVLW